MSIGKIKRKVKISKPISSAEKSAHTTDIVLYIIILALVVFNSASLLSLMSNSKHKQVPKVNADNLNNVLEVFSSNEQTLLESVKTMSGLVVSLGVLMGILLIVFLKLGKSTERLSVKIDDAESKYKDIYFVDNVLDIYKEITDDILRKDKDEKITIHVLAYTLHQIAYLFEKGLEANVLYNINLVLYYIDPEYIIESKNINDDWAKKLDVNINTIIRFINEGSTRCTLINNNVHIYRYKYNHLPAVNGIRVNDKYYISLATFDSMHQVKDSDFASYIRLLPEDQSSLAKHLRKVFENWLDSARLSSKDNEEFHEMV